MKVTDRLCAFLGKEPTLGENAFVAPTATVVGDVRLGDGVSVWYGAVLRADINFISIGEGSNLQDGVIGHLADDFPLEIGQYATIGHAAVIHACAIGDECLIGMNATVLDGAVIGSQSIVAAGSVVPEGMQIPDGSLVAGVPATIRKPLSRDRREGIRAWAEKYLEVAKAHRERLRS
ncbi:MAG TPA: gamma carbonic anhydrase family protein [Opitutae bacterium]|nr:gamma carbonic anhydrase family protein [Opitutae bacterium]